MTDGRDKRDAPTGEYHAASNDGAGAAITKTFGGHGSDTEPGAASLAGTTIASYKLLQVLGKGGMGVVYEAEQKGPVRRRVALKIIKPGMDSSQVVARFDAERQALALMDHPNIARVLDGGTTDEARPYFVMELVKGMPLSQYCDERRATVEDRLRLFLPVCHAVQHAHQKGIVHRDLKPSNVLVMEVDGKPVPKVIDFGLAKALHQPLTEHTMFTGMGAFLGTLEYMSPEQAGRNSLDIDTRTDVYSLGVMLYKLLTGTTPIDGTKLREMPLDGVMSVLREFEPPAPSLRLASLEAGLAPAARARSAESSVLVSQVKGELDWIVARAMEKDRNRRYPTVDALAADVERHLNGEPIEASPPSATYRLRKLARKYRKALITFGVATILIVTGLVVSVWQWGNARAMEAELALQRATNARTEQEFKALGISLMDGLYANDNSDGEMRDYMREEWLSDIKIKLGNDDQRGGLDPFLRHFLGVMVKDNDPVLAEQQLRKSLASLDADDPKSEDTIAVRNSLAMLLSDAKKFDEAIALYERNVEVAKAAVPRNDAKLLLCETNAANALLIAGRTDAAVSHLTAALELASTLPPREVRVAISCVNRLARSLANEKRLPTQLALLAEAYRLAPRMGADHEKHPVSLRALNNVATAHLLDRDYAKAVPLLEKSLALRQQYLGPNHDDSLSSINQLAMARLALKENDAALTLFRELMRRREAAFGIVHADTISAARTVVQVYAALRRIPEAEALLISLLRDYDAMTVDERKGMRPYVELLMKVYEKAEDDAKAKEWRAKLVT